MYKKPLRRSPSKKMPTLAKCIISKDQITRENGMNEVAKLTYKEQVLSALKDHTTTDPASALTVREAIEKSGLQFNPSSHSAAIGSIWRQFGVEVGPIKFSTG